MCILHRKMHIFCTSPSTQTSTSSILKDLEVMCIFMERVMCKKCAFYTVKCTFLAHQPPRKNAHHHKRFGGDVHFGGKGDLKNMCVLQCKMHIFRPSASTKKCTSPPNPSKLKMLRFEWRVMCRKCAFYDVKCTFFTKNNSTKMNIKNAPTNGTTKIHFKKCTSPKDPSSQMPKIWIGKRQIPSFRYHTCPVLPSWP